MSRWFRHYAGMMRDEKLVRAALRAKQSVERVQWVWGAILESAAELDDNGRYELDEPEVAYFLRADESDIRAVLVALTDAGRLAEGRVVNWGVRQFQSDRSADRQASYRKRKSERHHNHSSHPSDAGVTAASRHGDAPEAETETDAEIEPQAQRSTAARGRAELDVLETKLREAADLLADPAPGLLSLAPIIGLLDAGHDLDLDVLPTVRAVARRARRKPASWEYFTEAIREASARRRGLAEGGLSPPMTDSGKPQSTAEFLVNLGKQARHAQQGGVHRDDAGGVPAIRHAG